MKTTIETMGAAAAATMNPAARRWRRWETACEAIVGKADDLSPATMALLNAAGDIDVIERRIAENARTMAERFTKYAADIEAGLHATDPSGYSTVRDLPVDAAKLEAMRASLRMLLQVAFTKEQGEAFYAALAALCEVRA